MTWLTRLNGFIILVTTNVIALLMAIIGGLVYGGFYDRLFSGGWLQSIPADWANPNDLFNMIHLYNYACIMIAAAGWLIFIMSILQKEGIDTQKNYYYGR